MTARLKFTAFAMPFQFFIVRYIIPIPIITSQKKIPGSSVKEIQEDFLETSYLSKTFQIKYEMLFDFLKKFGFEICFRKNWETILLKKGFHYFLSRIFQDELTDWNLQARNIISYACKAAKNLKYFHIRFLLH